MRIAITQANFLPWLGYFELIDSVDCFVVLDDVQLVRRSYIVRNRIADQFGVPRWISLHVASCPQKTPLNEARVSRDRPWWSDTLRALDTNYRSAPHWQSVKSWLAQALPPRPAETIVDYNQRLLGDLSGMLGIRVAWQRASALSARSIHSSPEDQIVAICRALNASDYLNFRKGIDIGLYRPDRFASAGVRLWRQDYRHPCYRQGDGSSFTDYLSIVDLLAWEGPSQALEIIRSGRNWTQLSGQTAA